MKKRIFSMLLAIVMVVGLLPVTVLADSAEPWEVGDTYVSLDASDTPPVENIPEGAHWHGPEIEHQCTTPEHAHSTQQGCYGSELCGGLSLSHWWHRDSCYGSTLVCEMEEHAHDLETCPHTFTWTLLTGNPEDQYRVWWPVYWDFDDNSDVYEDTIVTVMAGGESVLFSDGELTPSQALSGGSATVGDTLKGITVDLPEGYYVSHYRIVCGNHSNCGVTPYNEGVHTGNEDGNYISDLTIRINAGEYDHWDGIGGLDEDYPMEPNSDGNYAYSGNNQIYPFYLLLEVSQDRNTYDIDYDWGTLSESLSTAVPEGEDELLRGAQHVVSAPSQDALEQAEALGYTFVGWEVDSIRYEDDAMVQPGNTITVYGAHITLVARWAAAVTYHYTGEVPADADELPAAEQHAQGDTVRVKSVPEDVTGYTFTGWTTDDVDVTDGSFTMPDGPVVFEGVWEKNDMEKFLSYTVEYYLNGVLDRSATETVTDVVWVGEDDTLAWNSDLIKEIPDYEFDGSDPDVIPGQIPDGSVIKLYYSGTNVEIKVEKSVAFADGSVPSDTDGDGIPNVQVGDVLQYTVTVSNSGNADAEDILIVDTPNGSGSIRFADTENENVIYDNTTGTDRFVIAELEAGSSESITYMYEVQADDEGKKLVNFAYHGDDHSGDGDEVIVEVDPQYTLTVETYLETAETANRVDSETYTLNQGDAWSVAVDTADATYNASAELDHNGVNYMYESGAASGTIMEDVTVKLIYTKDDMGTDDPEKPDDIPDKYQVTIRWTAQPGGTLQEETGFRNPVVVTVLDAQGEPAAQGNVTVPGGVTADAETGFRFEKWTGEKFGKLPVDLTGEGAEFAGFVLPNVTGGELLFKAYFLREDPSIELTKYADVETAKVGESIHYYIHVENTGNVALENVTVLDTFGGAGQLVPVLDVDGDGKNEHGVTYANGTFTIPALAVGQTVTIRCLYTVVAEDAGMELTNKVKLTNPEIPGTEDTEEVVITARYTVTYVYAEPVPTDAPDLPPEGIYDVDAEVTVADVPTLEGYVFDGWKKDGQTVTAFTMPETDVELVGSFSVDSSQTKDLSYTVEYYKDGVLTETDTISKPVQILQPNTLVVDATEINTTDRFGAEYDFEKTDPAELPNTIAHEGVIKVYYVKDVVGGDEGGDDVPDKYQKKITFKVVHGNWNDGTDADKVVYVTLVNSEGEWDKNGTAVLTAPEVGKQPDDGYKAGSWDAEPPATVSGTEDSVHTYTYRKKTVSPGGSSSGGRTPVLNKEDHVAYIIGYQDDTVRPQNNITRAEVATIFFRLLTDDSRAYYWSQTNDFSDVEADAWYNNAVSTMADAGVITGYPDGTFRPDAPITRAEFAAIAARFSDVGYAGVCSFSDVPDSFWGVDEIALAEHLGWITGYEDNTFRPNRYITRAEAMTLINRVLERAVEEPHMLPDMVEWIDNLPTAWYYEAVQEATNTHTYTRLRKTVLNQTFCYEDWIEILENPDWAALERTWSEANDQ